MRRGHVLLGAWLLAACDIRAPSDAAMDYSDAKPLSQDSGPSTGVDAGARWTRLCGTAARRPELGRDAYCPAVHDYVRRALVSDGGVPDAQVCGDAGFDAGPVPDGGDGGPDLCDPLDRAWGVIDGCPGWVSCDLGGPERCYHCPAWGGDPWGS